MPARGSLGAEAPGLGAEVPGWRRVVDMAYFYRPEIEIPEVASLE
jgi:hypothetical protein